MLSTRDVPNNKQQNSYMKFVIFIDLFLFHDDDAKYCWKHSAFALAGIFRLSFAPKNLVRIRFPGVIKPFLLVLAILQITSIKLSVVHHVLTEIYVLLTRKRLFETNFIDEYSKDHLSRLDKNCLKAKNLQLNSSLIKFSDFPDRRNLPIVFQCESCFVDRNLLSIKLRSLLINFMIQKLNLYTLQCRNFR